MAFGPPAAEYHRGDPLAWGGGALGSGSLPSTRHPRPSAPKRKAAAQPAAGLREQGYALATRARAGRVGGREACHRDWPPHSRLVSHRSAPRADPPGADPRSARALRSTSLTVYGSDPEPAYPRELVPTALARGGYLSGSTKNARGGNPATRDPASDGPHDAVFVRFVFFGGFVGPSTRPPRHTAASASGLGSQAATHLGRCPRRHSAVVLEANEFSPVPSPRASPETATGSTRVPYLCALPGALMAKVELSPTVVVGWPAT